jgi:hypothetical protein
MLDLEDDDDSLMNRLTWKAQVVTQMNLRMSFEKDKEIIFFELSRRCKCISAGASA